MNNHRYYMIVGMLWMIFAHVRESFEQLGYIVAASFFIASLFCLLSGEEK